MKVGFGQASIAPKGGKIAIAGSISFRSSDVVHDDIKANAMVVEDGSVRTIWVCCDMCHPTLRLTNDVVERLQRVLPEFKKEQLIMSATHATPYCHVTDDEYTDSGFQADYSQILSLYETRKQICDGVQKAVLEAIDELTECTLSIATAEILTGYCRRVVYKDGSAVMYGSVSRDDFLRMEYPDSSETQLIYFYNKATSDLFGIFAAVPCPSQADEASLYITADYWGVARDRIAQNYGGRVKLFGVCRSAGELSPHRLMKNDGGCPLDECGEDAAKRLGNFIADNIILNEKAPLKVYNLDELSHKRTTKVLSFPLRFADEATYREAEEYFADSDNFDENQNPKSAYKFYKYSHINKLKNEKSTTYDAQVSVISMADILFFTAPMELFTEYAKRIYTSFENNMVVDVQLTNDTLGYLPTKEAIEHGGYSTDYCSTVTTPEGGEYYIEEIKGMLNAIKPD